MKVLTYLRKECVFLNGWPEIEIRKELRDKQYPCKHWPERKVPRKDRLTLGQGRWETSEACSHQRPNLCPSLWCCIKGRYSNPSHARIQSCPFHENRAQTSSLTCLLGPQAAASINTARTVACLLPNTFEGQAPAMIRLQQQGPLGRPSTARK